MISLITDYLLDIVFIVMAYYNRDSIYGVFILLLWIGLQLLSIRRMISTLSRGCIDEQLVQGIHKQNK